jgi:hypothetical protein
MILFSAGLHKLSVHMGLKIVNNGAIRQQRWRQRQKDGKACLLVEVDETRLAAVLADQSTFLKTDAPSREELEQAVSYMLEALITRYEQERWPEI